MVDIRIVRSRTGFQVVPPTHLAAQERDVVFRNLSGGPVVVLNRDPPVFQMSGVPIEPDEDGTLTVRSGIAKGLYEYDVQAAGFFAYGASSPKIIVDP